MDRRLAILIGAVLMISAAHHVSRAAPADAIVPGTLRADATFEHIGVRWLIGGDADLDSSLTLEFRRLGDSVWLPGAPAMRASPTIIVDGQPLNLNYWAASALFLQSGQTYELRVTLSDPDGGGQTQVITATTRTEPQPNPAGQQRYVIPGSSGGDGTPGNPFKGLQAAANAAQPGDVFYVAAGTYSPFQLLNSGTANNPIVFLGPTTGHAILDGNGTDRGIVTLGEYNQPIGYVIVEGLILQNGHWGIDAQRSHDIVIRRNVIQNVDDGIVNRRDGGTEYNQTIADNLITGRRSWPGTGIPPEEGIDLRGTGNVVAHNTLRYFSDCISVVPQTGPSYGNDVYGNDVAYCVDDGIEIDYNQSNTRVWRNRVLNSRMGVSVQPMQGGPAYIFRNEFFNLESNPIKMNNQPTGYFVIHNSGAKHGNGQGDGSVWRNAVFRNNLFLGTRYAFEFTTAPDEGFRDFDYNVWGTTHAAGSASDPDFKWNNVRYSRLPNLQAIGVEVHGLTAAFSHLINAALPAAWNVDVTPGSRDLRLLPGTPEINAGVVLPNLDDRFVSDGQPDMGAFEFGQPAPIYGPRPSRPDFSPSIKQVNRSAPHTGEIITYTIVLRNVGAAPTDTVRVTDTVPIGLAYLNGTLTATIGVIDQSGAPKLRWSGTLSTTPGVTLTYRVLVTETLARAITNLAQIDAGSAGILHRSATVMVNARTIYLPWVMRNQ